MLKALKLKRLIKQERKFYKAKDYEKIIQTCKEILKIEKKLSIELTSDLVTAYYCCGKKKEAKQLIEKIFKQKKKRNILSEYKNFSARYIRYYYIYAFLLYEEKQYDECLNILDDLKKCMYDFSEKYVLSAKIYYRMGQIEKAYTDLYTSYTVYPHLYKKYIDLTEKILSKQKDNIKIVDLLLELYKRNSLLEEKIKENKIEEKPYSKILIARYYEMQNDFENAYKYYLKEYKLDNKNINILYNMAVIKYKLEHIKESVELFKKLDSLTDKYLEFIIKFMNAIVINNSENLDYFIFLIELYIKNNSIDKASRIVQTLKKLIIKDNEKSQMVIAKETEIEFAVIRIYEEKIEQMKAGSSYFEKKQDEKRYYNLLYNLCLLYKKHNININKIENILKEIIDNSDDLRIKSMLELAGHYAAEEDYISIQKIIVYLIEQDAEAFSNEEKEKLFEMAEVLSENNKPKLALKIYRLLIKAKYKVNQVLNKIEDRKEESSYLGKDFSNILLKRFKDLKLIGRGGMGNVYKAVDTILDREVAIKIIKPEYYEHKEAKERFIREAKIIAKLGEFKGIVSIYDIITTNTLAIIMQYIKGATLKEYILKEKINFKFFKNTVIQICDALAKIHSKNIVHRDIKPANIMIESNTVYLMDFGLSRLAALSGITAKYQIIGTKLYIPPEIIKGEIPDNRSDIYSLGMTMFQMLTGHTPFEDGDISYQHLHKKPPRPSKYNYEIREELDNIILKCIEKKREDRFADVLELKKQIQNLQF